MSLDKGFVKMYRDLREHSLWRDKPYARGQAWVDLILRASYQQSTFLLNGHFRKTERGQLFTSIRHLALDWGWSKKKVTLFLSELQKEKMITVEGDTEGTTVTIVNYGLYQNRGDTKETPRRHSGDTEETPGRHQGVTYKNIKEVKEVKEGKEDAPPEKETRTPEELRAEGWDI